MSEGLGACLMTCDAEVSLCLKCALIRDIPWVQVSGVQLLEKGQLFPSLDALLPVVEVEVWQPRALPVPSQSSEQK